MEIHPHRPSARTTVSPAASSAHTRPEDEHTRHPSDEREGDETEAKDAPVADTTAATRTAAEALFSLIGQQNHVDITTSSHAAGPAPKRLLDTKA